MSLMMAMTRRRLSAWLIASVPLARGFDGWIHPTENKKTLGSVIASNVLLYLMVLSRKTPDDKIMRIFALFQPWRKSSS